MENLRSSKLRPKGMWTLEEIKSGIEAFAKEHGRHPTALEIDSYEFLPSSRSLQRSFGGLVSIRKKLFPNEILNYTTGEYRSKVAGDAFRRAQDYEELFYDKLCLYFNPIAVHEHEIIRPGRVTSDFFIYLDEVSGVCLDLFYAKDMASVRGVVNNKVRRYKSLTCPVVFVLLHDGKITQEMVDKTIANRKFKIPYHIQVYTVEAFWQDYIPTLLSSTHFTKK